MTMPTHLTADEMKALVRQHFEDFVNNKRAEGNSRQHGP